MKNYIKLMRPKHYLKNILIMLPLVFSGSIFDVKKDIVTILGLLSFCFAASFVYVINDIKDREKDKLHEKKKNRPIASGMISVRNAIIFGVLLLVLSYVFNLLGTKQFLNMSYIYIIIYVLLNILYSFGLKDIPLLDVAILVSGFLIRVLYGSSLINVEISNWLYLTIISISFYLGLGKRRNELSKSSTTRKVLKYYNHEFLDKNMYMCLSISIIFYSLWCVDPITVSKTNNLLIWTIPMIILLCMKYSMDIERDGYGDPVDVITDDKVLLLLSLICGIYMFIVMYFV